MFGIYHLQQVYMNHLKMRIQHETKISQVYETDNKRPVRLGGTALLMLCMIISYNIQ